MREREREGGKESDSQGQEIHVHVRETKQDKNVIFLDKQTRTEIEKHRLREQESGRQSGRITTHTFLIAAIKYSKHG